MCKGESRSEEGDEVAIKTICRSRVSRETETVLREVRILKMLQGTPGVLQLKDFCYDASNFYLVTDLYEMNLFQYMNYNVNKLTESAIRDIFEMVVRALDSCHSTHSIVHCDIKPENILLNTDKTSGKITKLCVCDFGMA